MAGYSHLLSLRTLTQWIPLRFSLTLWWARPLAPGGEHQPKLGIPLGNPALGQGRAADRLELKVRAPVVQITRNEPAASERPGERVANCI